MDCAAVINRWRKWIRFVVVIIYIVLLVIAVPLCINELERKGAPNHVQAWFIGGMFVLMALPISCWGILQHIINYTTPYLQRHIIRILWMVPVYALNAWFALRFKDAAIYLDCLRECYEAYVIYNFMAYLLSFLHHEYPNLSSEVENNSVTFIFPLCFSPPCRNGSKFMQGCKHGVLQYTLVRPLMTAIAFICEMCGKYDEGDFNFTTAWSYIVIFSNLSQIFAMYCLVMFYRAFRQELKPLRPVPKFLCVKAVVFLSFWQGLLVAALTKLGAIPINGAWVFYDNIKEVSTGIQDFLICIEMFLAAIAHYYSFSHKPFVNLAVEQQNCCGSFFSMWDVRDVTGDVAEHARYISQGIKKTFHFGKRPAARNDERSPLLSEGNTSHVQNTAAAVEENNVSDQSSFHVVRSNASMNNYAIFENSTENQLKGLSRSLSLQGYGSCEEETNDSYVLLHDNDGEANILQTGPEETVPGHDQQMAPVTSKQLSSASINSDDSGHANKLHGSTAVDTEHNIHVYSLDQDESDSLVKTDCLQADLTDHSVLEVNESNHPVV